MLTAEELIVITQ